MESGRSSIGAGQCPNGRTRTANEDREVEQRLAALLFANAVVARDRRIFRNDRERLEAALLVRPTESKRVFAYFGFMISVMPATTIAVRVASFGDSMDPSQLLFVILILGAALLSGTVGYATGKCIPAIIESVGSFRVPNRLAMYSLVGFIWGAIAGSTGGLLLFVLGSIVAGLLGAVVGAITVPILVLAFEGLRRGDSIELKLFLPIAFGITLSVCAFMLGF